MATQRVVQLSQPYDLTVRTEFRDWVITAVYLRVKSLRETADEVSVRLGYTVSYETVSEVCNKFSNHMEDSLRRSSGK